MNPWFVQIFEVAFERRICCSRACSVNANPGIVIKVCGLADNTTWHLADELLSLQVMKPKYGPPDDSGTPSGCPSPKAISAPPSPQLPGAFSNASDVGLTIATTNAPCACAQSVSRSTSSRVPGNVGCCSTSATGSRPSGSAPKIDVASQPGLQAAART